VTANIEHKVWLRYETNDAVGLLEDFQTELLQIFRSHSLLGSSYDCLVNGGIVGKLVEACFSVATIHYFYFGVINTVNFSFYSDAARTLTVPISIVVSTVYNSKSDLWTDSHTLDINEVCICVSFKLIES
jgi:hypothetical protein